jgi:hypothetical protein
MSRRRAAVARALPVALALAVSATAATAPVATAQTAPISAARLQGSFLLAGRITTAVNVFGERRGQTFTRIWVFNPQCPAGPCTSVMLTRPRAGGHDTLLLTERSAGHYTGAGQFYVPLRCRRRVNPRGELVPFQISVTVTQPITTDSGVLAGRINATYTERGRHNLTRCVEPPSHDAATYHGHLISG